MHIYSQMHCINDLVKNFWCRLSYCFGYVMCIITVFSKSVVLIIVVIIIIIIIV